MKTVLAVLVVLALAVGIAPFALAEGYEHHDMDSMDVAHVATALMHMSDHPQVLRQLPAEKAIFLLQVVKKLAHNPFIDRSQLFDLQVGLTLRLLDLQVQRLQKVFPQPMMFPVDEELGEHHATMYVAMGRIHPMMGKMPLRDRLITKVDQFSFYSPRGCQLNQSKVARQNALKHNLFVGPCQTVGEESWGFNVWKI